MKKILLDCFSVDNHKTGVSQYAMELLKELFRLAPDEYSFHLLLKTGLVKEHEIFGIIDNAERAVTFEYQDIPAIGIKRDLKYIFLKKNLSYDLYHCLNSNLPLFMNRNCLVTIHDLKYLLYPQFIGNKSFLKKKYLEMLFYHAAVKAEKIITVSESTKRDFMSYFKGKKALIDSKTTAVHSGVNIDDDELLKSDTINDTAQTSGLSKAGNNNTIISDSIEVYGKYFLYLGELRPHKNVENLVKAFIAFKENNKADDIKLVVAGKMHPSMQNLEQYASSDILFAGYVDDCERLTLYKNAFAFYFATLYEGFGFPILEAMSVGTPVVTSNVSSMPEVAGDAALLVNPDSVEEIEKTMKMIYLDGKLRLEMIKKGFKQVEKFTWEKTAIETLQVYKSILSSGRIVNG
jgi:glycosyltransferase involved in cell wall biosynthesis